MSDSAKKMTESVIVELVKSFLLEKVDGNWHEEKVRQAKGHSHGADLVMVGGSHNGERFIIECKGRSYAKSANSINKEGWLNAVGQLVTRMDTERVIQSGATKGRINRAYHYGLGLYWVGAQVALRRIPKPIANVMNLYIFSVSDDGWVRQWSPKYFGKEHPDASFQRPVEASD